MENGKLFRTTLKYQPPPSYRTPRAMKHQHFTETISCMKYIVREVNLRKSYKYWFFRAGYICRLL